MFKKLVKNDQVILEQQTPHTTHEESKCPLLEEN